MQNLFQYTFKIAFVILWLLTGSCKKFIEVENPKDQVLSATVFSNDAAATSAMAGLYSGMMNSGYFFANGGITIAAGLCADEIYNRISGDETHFYQNSILSSDEFIVNTRLWSTAYKSIYHANAIIEGLERSSGVSAMLKSQLEGEAKFIRAFHYFYLVNLFGDVPLILSTDYAKNSVLPRDDQSKVYGQIIADLKEAKDLMSPTYASAKRTRPNKWAATALLSRVLLFTKDWQGAETMANEIINSGVYSMATSPDKVFLPSSHEIIWQLLPVSGSKTPTEAQAFLPAASASARPLYPLNPFVTDDFEAGDQRKMQWINSKVVSSTTYYYSTKFKVKVPASDPEEYNVVLRLAEQYLIRAEARAEQEKIIEGADDLNIVRNRAGLADSAVMDKAVLIDLIAKERRVELLNEWGHRWFDLKRWQKSEAILAVIKAPNWQTTDTLFPIPLTEIKRNPFLGQNPGY